MEISKGQFKVLRKLLDVLGGRCSSNGNTCPKRIEKIHFEMRGWNGWVNREWDCTDCFEMFSFLVPTEDRLYNPKSNQYECPCTHPEVKPVAIFRAEEVARNHLINRQFSI